MMTERTTMTPEFAEAFTDVLRELAEEVEWHHATGKPAVPL
jgi:hypothetical protein